ncbi:MAG: hypothetical protein HRT87_09945, partial [Legionellales bacterium]|nr:hypothetical protein [Legionellales bacterium]
MDGHFFKTYGQDTWTNVKKPDLVSDLYHYVFPIVETLGIYNGKNSPAIYGGDGTYYQGSLYQTPVVDITAYRSEIYGGYSQSALENNVFVPCSAVIEPTNVTNVKIFGGDTFIGMFELVLGNAILATDPFNGTGSGNGDEVFHQNGLETI